MRQLILIPKRTADSNVLQKRKWVQNGKFLSHLSEHLFAFVTLCRNGYSFNALFI